MTEPSNKEEVLQLLSKAFLVGEQADLRRRLGEGDDYYVDIFRTYLRNPFLRLLDEEQGALSGVRPTALARLIEAREAAARSQAPKYVVFCMPKSGSSFVQTALRQALRLPVRSLTAFGEPALTSHFGMNGREQELDEMAIARAVLISHQGFVAQHHTRYTMYLARQMHHFRMTPIVTVRNVFDCIVSFDDMMLQWRGRNERDAWVNDAQFALPANYPDLPPEDRYRLLAHSYGVWLINFYLSWKRGQAQGLKALTLRYEDHILHPDRLVETLADHIGMSDEQRSRLAAYAQRPHREASRLNVGRRGRGVEQIPEPTRDWLRDHAAAFRGELDAADLEYLLA